MPRLLLVDDNPSIHRIAESLLAPTDVELVCVDSAAEALDRIERGERFDVALVDTAMPGMDGWTLLTRLRSMEETARMPIALMAGVLDPVDPAKLAKAPIQGFLKKPIELRELGDRVKALLVAPVNVDPSPFSTVPATPARDLMQHAEPSLPELRPEVEEQAVEPITVPEPPAPEEDLLLLSAEDLWPEEPVAEPEAPAVIPETVPSATDFPEVQLELEELDLESLQDLTGEPLPERVPVAYTSPDPDFDIESMPGLAEDEDQLVTLSGLEDLESLPAEFELPAPAARLQDEAEPEDSFAHLPVAASLIGIADEEEPEPVLEVHEPAPAAHQASELPVAAAEPVAAVEPVAPAAGGQPDAVPGHSAPTPLEPAQVTPELARAVVQAMLADPVLVDALVKAVVARMGDQVLREIAWEVMPDLAGRLHQ